MERFDKLHTLLALKYIQSSQQCIFRNKDAFLGYVPFILWNWFWQCLFLRWMKRVKRRKKNCIEDVWLPLVYSAKRMIECLFLSQSSFDCASPKLNFALFLIWKYYHSRYSSLAGIKGSEKSFKKRVKLWTETEKRAWSNIHLMSVEWFWFSCFP